MSNNETQEERLIAVDTPLGTDVLLLTAIYGEEQISDISSLQIEVLSREASIDPKSIIGKPVDVRIKLFGGGDRFINGYVNSFTASGTEIRGLSQYSAEVVPWLWFLTQTADCRIFQKKSVPEILAEVFKDFELASYDDSGIDKGSYEKWEYCVQYRETDFNFVSRLMEQVGISYWFRHDKGTHTLVLADNKSAYKDCPEKEVGFASGSLTADHISAWQHQYQFHPGMWALTDYNFETPRTDLLTSTPTLIGLPDAKKYEVFDYPGEYKKRDEGESVTKLRMEQEEVGYHVVNATSACRTFTAGHKFKLIRHDLESEKNKSYVITRIAHNATDGTYVSGSEGSHPEYSNSFSCIPADVVFRPPRTTPKPLVQGPQTAMVVGPKGEEIYTDKHGRVKVQFHWDRYSKTDETSSCWMRVSQPWSGKRWGWMMIPRIGHEVIVEFLEGDPDRPVITGQLYNADSVPPYPLPSHATKTALKSYSSKGGGGFNEIRFEDKKGEEQVFIHAEKDLDLRIKKDRIEWVGHNQHLIVTQDKVERVDNERHEKVASDHMEEIGKDRHLKVAGKQAIETGGSHSVTVRGDVNESFKANHSEQTAQNYYLKAMGIVIESMTGITLKCGGSNVVIDSSGVTVKGPMVTIDGGMIKIASGPGSPPASGSAGNAVAPASPEEPLEADVAEPGQAVKLKQRQAPRRGHFQAPPVSATSTARAQEEESEEETSWIEIELVDEDDQPVPGERYEITTADGRVVRGTLDENGLARAEGVKSGECQISFPRLDREAWEKV